MKKEIIGSKFILRDLRPIEDKESIIRNINNKKILNKISLEFPYTDKDYEKFIEMFDKEKTDKDADINFIIDVDGEAVGCISLMRNKRISAKHIAEIGYWLGEDYWGRGIATEATKLLSNFAFNEINIMKIIIQALEDNIGSRKVAEKNNFKLEYIRKKEAFKEGKYKDLVCYSMFNDNFRK